MQSCCMLNLKTKKMVDWKRLGLAVLCSATFIGGFIILIYLPIYVIFPLTVVGLVFLFYKALGGISKKDKNGTDKD